MLTVACVLSPGPVYNVAHVSRLHMMAKRHLKQPHQFVCVTDSIFPGWWAKISLFKPARFHGRVLYLDLDVTVTGSLDELADFDAPFVLVKDWQRIGYNSSVMSWDAGHLDRLYTEFTDDDMKIPGGDQSYIWAKMPGAAKFPKPWCRSFKRIVLMHEPTDDMRVCVFHGRPKPWDVEPLV